MKSILFLITGFKRGGAETQISILSHKLLDLNYKVSLVIIGSYIEYEFDNRLNIYHINPGKKYFNKFSKLISLIKIVKKVKPDIAKGFLGSGVNWLILLSWFNITRKKVKYIACLRTGLNNASGVAYIKTYIKYRLFGYKLNGITINHKPSEKLLNNNPFKFEKSQIHYIPNAINLNGVNHEYSHKLVSFISPGTIQKRKNQNLLVRGLSKFNNEERERLKFNIIGEVIDEEYYNLISNSIRNNNLNDLITILPKTKSVHDLYLNVDSLILPSCHEGFPNVLLEAMKYGKVILISRQAEANNVIRDGYNGFLFDAYNANSLKDAILKAIALSPEQIKRMCAINTKLIKEKYSIEKVVKQWEQLYN